MSKIPGIGDIPILGALFKSKSASKNQTELVVMITPQILPEGSGGVTTQLPQLVEPYLPPVVRKKPLPTPPPAFTSPRPGGDGAANDTPPVSSPAAVTPQVSPAVSAAAAVSALTPQGPTVVQEPTAATTASASKDAPAAKAADLKVLEKARREEQRAAQEQVKRDTVTARQAANEAEIQRHKDELETKRQEQLTREQTKRDAAAAAKTAQAATRQAEIDRKQQKVIDEASARLKAAAATYQAEIAKKDKTASDH
jgi:hypothetical protein